uniref:Uncharacterized protein n=1 Tax=Trichobilharzia regenti TaxID=157069 RepID=A0AA85ILC1_TRIRE|nr:unnamed protein product [Trichobilharzia regenti]
MVIVVCFSSSVQVLDLPGNILHHLISVYSFDVFDPPRQVFVDSQLTTFRFVCSLKLKKIILISLSEFKYLHECCPDRKFSKCLSSYLKRCKSSPVLFVASHFQPSISNGPMWKVVCSRLVKAIVIEESMSWLSTLGGGYSSLGDQNDYAASLAGTVSIFQMSLALEVNSPTLLAKSQLWFAQSLMQRGFLKQSAGILRRIYTLWKPLMKPDLPSDMRIDHMAVGLWARLRHLWQQKHQPMKKRKNVSKHHIPLPVNSSLISLYPHVNMLVSRI